MKLFRVRRRPTRTEEILPLRLAGLTGEYQLKRSSARRTLALRVSEQGAIVVNAPLGLSGSEIERFLEKHADWLRRRRQTIHSQVFQWRDGAELPWLGGYLTLRLVPPAGRVRVRREGDSLVCAADPDTAPASVKRWYVGQARVLLGEAVAAACARLGRTAPPLHLSDARTRWGSLSPRGVLRLNWRLVKASQAERDYVICHELAHFRRRDHSAAFWEEVEALFPGHAPVRESLRRQGQRYFAF